MIQIMSEVLLEWMTRASGFQVFSEGPIIAKTLVHLISLAVNPNEAIISSACSSSFCQTVCTFLDNSFHFPASCLFNLKQIEDNSASEEDIFGLCLTVLLGCLQSKNKQVFMDAALEMDIDKQRIVFHLVREPMTQLTADRFVTRESILSGFRHGVPSPRSLSVQAESLDRSVVAPLGDDFQSTPIKSVSNDSTFKKADAMESHISYISRPNSMPESLESSLTSLPLPRAPSTGCISTDSATVHRLLPDAIGKVVCTVDGPLSEADVIDPSISKGDTCYQQYSSTSSATTTIFKRPNAGGFHLKRPTNLTLMTNVNSPTQHLSKELATSGNQLALPDSPFGDSMDSLCFKKLQSLPPLASPLNSVKHLVDSPLWSHKIRLREMERERRRLQTDLETERVYRDEAEHTIAEMRQQLDEAGKRAAEAESRAGRLTRQLNSQQDQQDEFLACKAELALREEEIDSLKKRLTSFQDIVSHAKKLRVENVNLQQECADRQQKIDQLTGKLSEAKSQRIVCSELETLRTKLRDAETQLAQQLLDSESVENEARRQQEMFHHLRLQHSMAKMRLSAKNEQSESNPGRAELCPVTSGENLGAVLESELHSAQSEVGRLNVELSSVMAKLSVRDSEVDQFTSRLSELVSDLADASAQREMTEMALRTALSQLQLLQGDTEVLLARLEAWHCPVITADDIDAGSLMSRPLEELNAMTSDLDDHLSGLLSTCLLRINELFENNITSVIEYVREISKDEERKAFSAKQLASDSAQDALVQQLQSVKTELTSHQTKYETVAEQLSNAMTSVQAQTQLAAQLQKTVAALESEKQTVESGLTELQERSNKELQASRELLDSATSRLRELETELSRYRNAADVRDVAVSTELWVVGAASHLPADEFEADELDEAVNHEGVEEVDPCVEHEEAYEALAADRRGLSDELVRLHDELSDANTYTVHLERQVTELQDKLATCEEDLCRQTALLTRAQENWAIVERERRDAEHNLADLRNMYSMELQALGADLLPHMNRTRAEASATAAQVDAVSARLQAERFEFKNKLSRATYELEAMNTDKLLLSERNDHLQHEVDNLRVLVIKMATGVAPNNGIAAQSYLADRHRPSEVLQAVMTAGPSEQQNSSAAAEAGGSLEKWLEATYESRSRGKATEPPPPAKLPELRLSDTPPSSMSSRHLDSSGGGGGGVRCSDGDVLSQGVSRRADVIRYPQLADGGFPGYSCQTDFRCRQATGLEHHGGLQLGSAAQQHRASRQMSSQMSCVAITDPAGHLQTNGLDNIGYSAPLLRLDRLAAINERHNREKQQQKASVRRQDLDTDADSSAYTDLSQVSVRSHPSRMLPNPQPTDPGQNVFPSADATLLAYGDGTNLSSVSPRKSHTVEPDSASVSDPTRINELHRRNRLQPLHLRTSYPVETQSVDPLQVADALGHLSSTDRANQRPLGKKAEENLGNVLREVDEENVLFDQLGKPSPLAAGYREPPKDLHSITNALIAASDDPHSMVAALAAKLSHTSAQMGAIAEAGASSRLRCPGPTSSLAAPTNRGSQKPGSRLSWKPQPSLDEVEQFTRRHLKTLSSVTSSRAPTRPVSAMWIPVTDENFHPPQTPFSGSTDRLAHSTTNPTAVAGCSGLRYYPRGGQRSLSSSDDGQQSVCSSVRSSKSSVAFEIPVNDGENKARRGLPHRRVLSSNQQVGAKGDVLHKNSAGNFVAPNHCSNLKMATTLPRATASRQHKTKLP